MRTKPTRRIIRPLKQERDRSKGVQHALATDHDPAKLLSPTSRIDYEAAVLKGAVCFTASRRVGVGRYETRECNTLSEAVQAVADMGVDGVGIYAVNAAGRSVLILANGKIVKP